MLSLGAWAFLASKRVDKIKGSKFGSHCFETAQINKRLMGLGVQMHPSHVTGTHHSCRPCIRVGRAGKCKLTCKCQRGSCLGHQ